MHLETTRLENLFINVTYRTTPDGTIRGFQSTINNRHVAYASIRKYGLKTAYYLMVMAVRKYHNFPLDNLYPNYHIFIHQTYIKRRLIH